MKDLGQTKSGFPIIAQGCAENNSGVVYQSLDCFVISMSYPIDMEEDGTEIYEVTYTSRSLALAEFKKMLGSFGYGQ